MSYAPRRRARTAPVARRPYRPRVVPQVVEEIIVAPSVAPQKKRGLFSKLVRGVTKFASPLVNAGLSILQKKAMAKMGMASGHGNYSVSNNTILSPNSQIPQFSNLGQSVRCAHREFIQDINSSTAFALQSFSINPGLSGTFPWLSAIANQFEQYKIHGLMFEFRTTSSDALNSTNTALGTMILATEYNVLLPSFTNKQQMENTIFSTSGKPSTTLLHPIECDPSQTPNQPAYIRSGATLIGDNRLYDLGNFQIASVGSQASSVVGELWITYDITFYKPILNNSAAFQAKTAHYVTVNPGNTTFTSIGDPALLTTSMDTIGGLLTDSLPLIPASAGYQFPLGTNGVYQFVYWSESLFGVFNTPATVVGYNCTVLQTWSNGAGTFARPVVYEVATVPGSLQNLFVFIVRINDPTAVASVAVDLTTTYFQGFGDWTITQLNGNYPDSVVALSAAQERKQLLLNNSMLSKQLSQERANKYISCAAASTPSIEEEKEDEDELEFTQEDIKLILEMRQKKKKEPVSSTKN